MGLVRFIAEVLRRSRKPNFSEAAHITLGREGEEMAARYLSDNELVFVEVKTRTDEIFGRASEAVDQKKRALILRGAMKWLRMLDMPDITYRFDIVEVVMGPPIEIRVIENAFNTPEKYTY